MDAAYPPQPNLSGRGEAGPDDAEIGRQWREDSSLEKWFPITAEQLARSIRMTELQDQRIQALEAENAALKREAHTWWTACKDATQELERLRAAQRPLTDHDRALTGAKCTAPAGTDC